MLSFNSSAIKGASVVLGILLAVTPLSFAGQRTPKSKKANITSASLAEQESWNNMKLRLAQYDNFLSGNLWSLIHSYSSKDEMERSLKLFESIALTLTQKDPASIRKFDGPDGFKSQLVQMMNSSDDTVSGFAASLLAVIGDLKYAPQIAALLDRQIEQSTDSHPTTARGRAAIALGLLGAKQYTEQIAALLRSRNDYDRAGSATALGYLKATEHARDVVELMLSDDPDFHDDESPVESLVEMGVAAQYKSEIAQLLGDESHSQRATAAAYALAHLRAREFAKDVAKLLDQKYRKADAAKALAFMGAAEYAPQIALLLKDESSLDRKAAALALGILSAKEYAPEIAKLLDDRTNFVPYFAAVSLVLLGGNDQARRVVPLINKAHKSGPYLDAGDFHQLVQDEALQLSKEFRAKFAQMKARTARRG
jgi:HEAT repeat protein